MDKRLVGVTFKVSEAGPTTWTLRTNIAHYQYGGITVPTHTCKHPRSSLQVGDTVVVQRAGDVIPQIVRVVMEKRRRGTKPYEFPRKCPACGSHAVREVDEATGKQDVDRRCTGGLICPAQAVERLRHFVSRDAFDIEGLGGVYIETLYENGLLKEPADIFALTRKSEVLGRVLAEPVGLGVEVEGQGDDELS